MTAAQNHLRAARTLWPHICWCELAAKPTQNARTQVLGPHSARSIKLFGHTCFVNRTTVCVRCVDGSLWAGVDTACNGSIARVVHCSLLRPQMHSRGARWSLIFMMYARTTLKQRRTHRLYMFQCHAKRKSRQRRHTDAKYCYCDCDQQSQSQSNRLSKLENRNFSEVPPN